MERLITEPLGEPLTWLSVILTAIMLSAGLVGALYYRRFIAVLRTRHPAVWNNLGSPTLILSNTPRNSALMSRFLIDEEYETLGDPELNRLGRQIGRARKLVEIPFLILLTLTLFGILRSSGLIG